MLYSKGEIRKEDPGEDRGRDGATVFAKMLQIARRQPGTLGADTPTAAPNMIRAAVGHHAAREPQKRVNELWHRDKNQSLFPNSNG